jgi:pseudouridine-5'-phosphate glycosidase
MTAIPAFYTRTSGVRLDHRVESAAEAAAVVKARFALGQAGVLLANPIPEEAALDPAQIAQVIEAALARADAEGVRGKRVTPFLLAELERATGGTSVRANRALALNNARLGAELAAAMEGASGT